MPIPRVAEVGDPYGLQFTVGFVENPTVLGRFVNRPYGLCITVGLMQKSNRARADEGIRPYGLCFTVGLMQKSDRARADEGAGVQWTPLSGA